MEKLIGKGNVEQFNYFSFYFTWDYYYGAGYLFYKKIKDSFSNERIINFCISV
ncbi:hypothetical protein [Crassaminicella profunda]|uniref:hypothetical protein n=1 Tax=Crassaminicella profunda TaxID=1286698 RepID=UPI001CA70189|nr:hypothetical protein [Crassaminicella profunda]QZY53648.1 hypothetical protein K7H06_11295 [Crassaminicella profunda]